MKTHSVVVEIFCRGKQKEKRSSRMWNRRAVLDKFHTLVCLLVCLKSIPWIVKTLLNKKAAQKRFSVRTVWIKQKKQYRSSMGSVCAITDDSLLLSHTVSLSYILLSVSRSKWNILPDPCDAAQEPEPLSNSQANWERAHTHTLSCDIMLPGKC